MSFDFSALRTIFLWLLLETVMLRALYTIDVGYDLPFLAILLLAFIPWIPIWLIVMWGQKNNFWWQGIRLFSRCTQILAILLCVLVGFWDAGMSGDNWAQGLMYSALYALIPFAFSRWRPRWTHRIL